MSAKTTVKFVTFNDTGKIIDSYVMLSYTVTPPRGTPILRAGETWHYQATGLEGYITERILRTEACGGTQCIVDSFISSTFNETSWGTSSWDFFKDYCIGCNGPGAITYTAYTPLPLHPYRFPLEVGSAWYVNDTESGWNLDHTGNRTFTFSGSQLFRVLNETTVTVPAGSIDAFLIAQYGSDGTTVAAYRWFSVQAKTTVKLIRLDSTGVATYTRVMVSYAIVGVNIGDSERLGDILVSYQSNDTGSPPGRLPKDISWISATVQKIEGSNVTLSSTFHYKNGTLTNLAFAGNLSSGFEPLTNVGPPIIMAGLNKGDPIPNWRGLSINYTTTRTYLGAPRELDVLNFTHFFAPPLTGYVRHLTYYDRSSGLLLETLIVVNGTYVRNAVRYSLLQSVGARLVSTNVWQTFTPAVKQGDSAKYGNISGSYQSNIPGDYNPVKFFQDALWETVGVSSVSETNVTFAGTLVFNNAAGARSAIVFGSIKYGYGNLTSSNIIPFLLAGNLRAGDPVLDPAYSPRGDAIINQTVTRNYLGVDRKVNILNFTVTFPGPPRGTGYYRLTGVYDQATGMLLEFSFTKSLSYQSNTSNSSAVLEITETNLWTASTHPDFGLTSQANQVAIQPGTLGTAILTLASLQGFADTVSLAAVANPSRPSLTISASVMIAAGSPYTIRSVPLTVSVPMDLPTGTFTVTVTGTSGSIQHVLVMTVLVNRPPQLVECRKGNTCSIQSNVLLSDLKFAGNTIHLTATGPSGTLGFVNVTIPVVAVPHKSELKVFIDKNELSVSSVILTLDPTGTNYYCYFTFTFHSPVDIDIQLSATQNSSPSPSNAAPSILGLDAAIFYGLVGPVIAVVIALAVFGLRRSRRSGNPTVM